MIGIVSYGLGNIHSFINIFNKLNQKFILLENENDIKICDKFILPGVGAFDSSVNKITKLNYFNVLKSAVLNEKKKILGICVGMQVLFNSSEEGSLPGLGWLDGNVKKFMNDKKYRVPHMGWNTIKKKKTNKIFEGVEDESEFYFLHSYYCIPKNSSQIIAKCDYGINFCCAVQKENIFGIQFHPEKSHDLGERVINNFISI